MTPKSIHPSTPRRNAGFALVVALSLMAFILLLLLSLTTFVSVESSSAANFRASLEAKQNAELSLMVAVGELQKHAGLDQRVTARSDLSFPAAQNGYWTGIWDSTDTTLAPAWIVSGNEGLETNDPNYLNPASNVPDPSDQNDSIWLVKNSVATPTDQVKVNSNEITGNTGNTTGRYAFWAGDEGIKAKFNIVSEDNTESNSRTASPTTLAYQFGINQIDNLFQSEDLEDNVKTGAAASMSELALLTSDNAISKNYFHDLTAVSQGLLTDTKNGGFKKDLTYAFENSSVYNLEFGASTDNEDRFFMPDLIEPTTGHTGPNWDILRAYYNLYNDIDANGSIELQAANPGLSTALRTDYVPYKHGLINDFWYYDYTDTYQRNSPVTPVVSRLQLDFGIKTSLYGGAGQYKIELEVRPIFGIYNPYNVAIQNAAYQVNLELNPSFELVVDGVSYTFNFDDQNVLTYGSNYMVFYVETPSSQLIDFQPGETRLFSPLNRKLLKNTSNGVNEFYILRNTYTVGGSLYFTVRDSGGNIIYANPDSVIQVKQIDVGEDTFVWLRGGPSRSDLKSLQRIKKLWQDSNIGPKLIDSSNPPAPATAASLETGDELASWAFQMQTSQSSYGLRNGIDNNLRTLQGSPDWDGFINGNGNTMLSGFSFEGDRGLLASPLEPETYDNVRYSGLWGNSITAEGQGHVVLFDVPREPLLSIGALQHANLSRYNNDPSLIIGNSYANPRIPADATENIGYGGIPELDVYDWPYLVNEQVWDSYFFSSIDPNLNDTEIENLIDDQEYRNKRYQFTRSTRELIDDAVFSNAKDNIDDYHALASYMAVNGPFNVNSTSVNAWISVLSSMNNLSLPVYDPSTNVATSTTGNLFFTRLSKPYGSAYKTDDNSGAVNFWRGFQELSANQIADLAQEIVDLIKARGQPFGTMAEFVNRSLNDIPETNDDERLSGILQEAIDNTSTQINSKIDSLLTLNSSDTEGPTPFPTHVSGSQAASAPGHLLQGDILQALAPILTTRSDTFIVRAYGDARNPLTDAIESKAYCEAVVQRLPEPVEGDVNSSVDRNNPSGNFGRQFRIIKLRWLSPEEV
ncbi:hypothetical protein [Coraliomargarita parva]|uniref:hypothetical protein n=1 Tax=Coraliomargarita parva TaxID=3014050 RepID=UPI0022B3F65D|nr:hypothetical protein [Coraliomargarita parva]